MSSTSFETYSTTYKDTQRYVSGTFCSQPIVSESPLEGVGRWDATSLRDEFALPGCIQATPLPATPLPPPAAKLPTHRDTSVLEDMTQKNPFHVVLQRLRQPCKANGSETDNERSQPSTSQPPPFKFISSMFSLGLN